MKIKVTIREMLEKCNDFDGWCRKVGLNPWCINEGLATGDEKYKLTVKQAKKYGMLKE